MHSSNICDDNERETERERGKKKRRERELEIDEIERYIVGNNVPTQHII